VFVRIKLKQNWWCSATAYVSFLPAPW